MNPISNWYKDYEKKRKRVTSKEYINWLVEFSKSHTAFADDQWVYQNNEICGTDYENVLIVSTLVSMFEDYCILKQIDVEWSCDKFTSFTIAVNFTEELAISFETVIGQGAITYVRVIPSDSGDFNLSDFLKEDLYSINCKLYEN